MEINVAVIDLGSNSVRMTVSAICGNKHENLDYRREYVRLSDGMSFDNVLKQSAMERTILALEKFTKTADDYKCKMIVPIATAAVRRAVNKEDFLKEVKRRTGLEFEIIDGEREAYYDYLGVTSCSNIRDALLIDVGGGSTELVLIKERAMAASVSLPYGAVILTERFIDKPQSALYRFISMQISSVEWIDDAFGMKVVGIGGTVRALARGAKKLEDDSSLNFQNHTIPYAKVNAFYHTLCETPRERRGEIPGVLQERADIVLGGMTPIKALMDILASPRLIASCAGVREGVLERLKREVLRHNLNYEV